jgi:DNA excision repair protein ERCC-8
MLKIISNNLLNNLDNRNIGCLRSNLFISNVNKQRIENIELSKYCSVPSLSYSVTWLSLDYVENRYLLASKCDGNFVCIDMLNHNRLDMTGDGKTLKFLFDSSKKRGIDGHKYSVNCIQWYPIDSGMFFTSGMDSKLKVWDTNSLQPVDDYTFDSKIYSHNISRLVSAKKTLIALALENGQIRLVDINSGSSTHTIKANTTTKQSFCVSVQWSPIEPNQLISGG